MLFLFYESTLSVNHLHIYCIHMHTMLIAIFAIIHPNPIIDGLSSFLLHLRPLEKYPIHAIMMKLEMVMRYLVIASNIFIESAFFVFRRNFELSVLTYSGNHVIFYQTSDVLGHCDACKIRVSLNPFAHLIV